LFEGKPQHIADTAENGKTFLHSGASGQDRLCAMLATRKVSTAEGYIRLIHQFNLDPVLRKRLRKKGTKRAGYVEDVLNASNSNSGVIPSSFDLAAYNVRKKLDGQLQHLLDLLLPVVEAVNDTKLGLGSDLMHESDSCYSHLKRGAKDSAALTEVVSNIAKTFAGQGKKKSLAKAA
jgi:hypothetical protein